MIPPAPPDFWTKVIERVAQLVWERETNGAKAKPAFTSVPVEHLLRNNSNIESEPNAKCD
jgi:hypothetical protein